MSDFNTKMDNGYFDMEEIPCPKAPKKSAVTVSSGLYKKEYAKYQDAITSFRKEYSNRRKEFKASAIAECGLTNNPKAEAAFDMAWEDSHSEGLKAVYDRLWDLAQIMG